jgi:hypothetical protein
LYYGARKTTRVESNLQTSTARLSSSFGETRRSVVVDSVFFNRIFWFSPQCHYNVRHGGL